MPQPVGAAIPPPLGYTLAGLDPSNADITGSIRERILGESAMRPRDAVGADGQPQAQGRSHRDRRGRPLRRRKGEPADRRRQGRSPGRARARRGRRPCSRRRPIGPSATPLSARQEPEAPAGEPLSLAPPLAVAQSDPAPVAAEAPAPSSPAARPRPAGFALASLGEGRNVVNPAAVRGPVRSSGARARA